MTDRSTRKEYIELEYYYYVVTVQQTNLVAICVTYTFWGDCVQFSGRKMGEKEGLCEPQDNLCPLESYREDRRWIDVNNKWNNWLSPVT